MKEKYRKKMLLIKIQIFLTKKRQLWHINNQDAFSIEFGPTIYREINIWFCNEKCCKKEIQFVNYFLHERRVIKLNFE